MNFVSFDENNFVSIDENLVPQDVVAKWRGLEPVYHTAAHSIAVDWDTFAAVLIAPSPKDLQGGKYPVFGVDRSRFIEVDRQAADMLAWALGYEVTEQVEVTLKCRRPVYTLKPRLVRGKQLTEGERLAGLLQASELYLSSVFEDGDVHKRGKAQLISEAIPEE